MGIRYPAIEMNVWYIPKFRYASAESGKNVSMQGKILFRSEGGKAG